MNFIGIRNVALALLPAAMALVPTLSEAIGSTPVTVVNPADIAKAQGIQQPFVSTINCSAAGGFGVRCRGSTSVPAGQRWVIEYVSASCLIDNSSQAVSSVYISASTGGSGTIHYLAIPDHIGAVGDSGFSINVVQFGQAVRIYADAGSSVQFAMGTTGATGFSGYPFCSAVISGQAVSVP